MTFETSARTQRSAEIGFNLELAFQLAHEPTITQRRRLALVTEAFRSIADRDRRLASCVILPLQEDGWVHICAVICARQPGEAAELSELWMAEAIAAANLADDPVAARVPDQRGHTSVSADSWLPALN
ncbi:MAG: hypothetical protein WC054_10255 [Candidatus Nanopelagicales bacterium]